MVGLESGLSSWAIAGWLTPEAPDRLRENETVRGLVFWEGVGAYLDGPATANLRLRHCYTVARAA